MRKLLRGLALAASAAIIAGTSAGVAQSVDFTCAYQHACFFQNDDYTGNVKDYTAIQVDDNLDTWIEIPSGERGSMTNNNPDFNIQVYAADTGAHQTVFSGTRAVLGGTFGWWCTGAWADCDQDLPAVLHHGVATACTEKVHDVTSTRPPHPHAKITMRPNPNSCGKPIRARIGCAYTDNVPHSPAVTIYFTGNNITKRPQVSTATCKPEPFSEMQFADWSGYQNKYGGKWHTYCLWRFHLRCQKHT